MSPQLVIYIISATVSVIGLVAGAIGMYVSLSLKTAIAEVSRQQAEWHIQNLDSANKGREEFRQWINGSFMRVREVQEAFKNYDEQLRSIRDDLRRLER